jgi:hypothetical protein
LSFVEKHKAWLLPLLGAGVLAVAVLNLRSLKPRPAPAPAPPGPAPALLPMPSAPPGQAQAQAPAQTPQQPGSAGDLWGDLKALAKPPAAILAEAALRDRSRENLDALLDPRFPTDLPRPGLVREAQPIRVAGPADPAAKAPVAPPLPELEFILSCPQGLQAWFQGRPYLQGQTLPGGGFRIGSIQWDQVTLVGPAGRTVRQQTHSRNLAAGSRPIVEAP